MSFYITIKEARVEQRKINNRDNHAIVITSENNRLITYFSREQNNKIFWNDALVSQSSQLELEFMLVRQKIPGKTAERLSSNTISLSKYLFWTGKDNQDQIPLYDAKGKYTDTLLIEMSYRQNKHFIGPIQFYRRGADHVDNEDGENILQIEGDKSKFSFWRLIGRDKDDPNSTLQDRDKLKKRDGQDQKDSDGKSIFGFLGIGGRNKSKQKDRDGKEGSQGGLSPRNNGLDENGNPIKSKKGQNVKFYKGAHKNKNIFSFCDQVHDDQKFTVVQNYYDDEPSSSSSRN